MGERNNWEREERERIREEGGGRDRTREETEGWRGVREGGSRVARDTCSCVCGRMSTRFSCSFTTCLMSVLKDVDGTGDFASHYGSSSHQYTPSTAS